MSSVLIFTETFDHKCKAVTFEILGKIAPAKADVVCVGKLPADQVAELAKFGAENVYQISGEALTTYSPEGYATALETVIKNKNYDYVFCGATSLGKDLFPRLATIFNAGLASDVTHFTMDGGTFNGMRPFFSGKCLAKVKIEGPKPHFISIRPNSLGLPKEMNNAAGTTAQVSWNSSATASVIGYTVLDPSMLTVPLRAPDAASPFGLPPHAARAMKANGIRIDFRFIFLIFNFSTSIGR